MDIKEIQEAVKNTLLNVGVKIYKIYSIYLGMLLVLNLMIFLLMKPIVNYTLTVYEYIGNGNYNIPEAGRNLYIAMLLILIIALLSRLVTLGWDAVCLKASRGVTDISFHDLSSMFPLFWKAAAMYVIEYVLVQIGLLFFIIPGIILLLRWSMAFYVLIEHPDYGPLKCLRQSGRLMVGEIRNLLRLCATFLFQYLIAAEVWYFSSRLLNLWKVPPIALGYSSFYNRLVCWKPGPKADE